MSTQDFSWWQDALAGKKPAMHEGEPHHGYYRKREKNGPDQPVAIYDHEGTMICLLGTAKNSRQVDPLQIWTWVCDKPVSYPDWQAAHEQDAWVKAIEGLIEAENPRARLGGNKPPDPFDELSKKIADVVTIAETVMSSDIKSKDDADRMANTRDRLMELNSQAETARKDEKKPHYDAATAVQKKWRELMGPAEDLVKKLRARITDWINAEEQRQRKEALEAAKAAEAKGEELPDLAPEPVRVGGGVSGRRTSNRSFKTATITDPVAFATWLLEKDQPHADVMATLQKVANQLARSGANAPGIETSKQKAAA